MQRRPAKEAEEAGVIVLRSNFDRLSVLSVTAEVSVDDDDNQSEEEEEGGKPDALSRRWGRLTIGPKGGSTNVQRPKPEYDEAVGDARLAWRWVQGWRARLQNGGDIVEKVRWEWRLDRQMAVVPNTVPVVVAARVPEVVVECGSEVEDAPQCVRSGTKLHHRAKGEAYTSTVGLLRYLGYERGLTRSVP